MWPTRVEHVATQGMLDWKFLNDRFQRGKEHIQAFMDKKHKLICLDSLVVGHAAIVQRQQEMGSNALPGSKLDMLYPDLLWIFFKAPQLSAN